MGDVVSITASLLIERARLRGNIAATNVHKQVVQDITDPAQMLAFLEGFAATAREVADQFAEMMRNAPE